MATTVTNTEALENKISELQTLENLTFKIM